MRWFEATLYERDVFSRDKLGHDLSREKKAGSCIVRKAPVKAQQYDTEGNRFKYIRRVFLTPTPADEFRSVTSIETRGRRYELESAASLEDGHTMLTCVHYKPEVENACENHR